MSYGENIIDGAATATKWSLVIGGIVLLLSIGMVITGAILRKRTKDEKTKKIAKLMIGLGAPGSLLGLILLVVAGVSVGFASKAASNINW